MSLNSTFVISFPWSSSHDVKAAALLCWSYQQIFKMRRTLSLKEAYRSRRDRKDSRVTTFLSSVLVCRSFTDVKSIHKHLTSLWTKTRDGETWPVFLSVVTILVVRPQKPQTGRLSQRQYGGLWLVHFFQSISPLVHPSIGPSICTTVHLSVHLPICPSIHL